MDPKLKAVRAGHRGNLTKIFRKFEELKTRGDPNLRELSILVDSVNKKKETLEGLNEKILDLTSEEDVAQELDDQDEYAYELELKLREMSELLDTYKNGSQQTLREKQVLNPHANSFTPDEQQQSSSMNTYTNYTSVSHANQPNIISANSTHTSNASRSSNSDYHKLPKLNLPTFTGNMLDWQAFWDSYDTAVHSNPTLSEVQKFNYLKSLLQDEAYRTITGFALTHANYEKAISLLHARYGQEHKIVQTYMQELLKIPAPVYTLTSLRNFYDQTETYVRGLESLGQTNESYGSLLVPVILNKLPSEVCQNLARINKSTNWTLDNLRNAIYDEVNVLEAGQKPENLRTGDHLATAAFFMQAKPRPKSSYRKSESNRSDQKRNLKQCRYCDDPEHLAMNCTKYTCPDTRMEVVKKKKLCFNCLGDHKISECKSTTKCRKCDKRHHTSLCKKTDETEKPKQENIVLHSSFTQQKTSTVMLKTAVASVSSGAYTADANISLDEGAQRSFITEDFATKINLSTTETEEIHLAGFGAQNREVRHLKKAEVNILTNNGGKIPISVLVIPEIAVPIQTHVKSAVNMKHLKGLKLAHPVSADETFKINFLIGADYFWQIVGDKVIRGDGPTAVESKIGYLLSGPVNSSTTCSSTASSVLNVLVAHKMEDSNLERYWELESLGVKNETETEKTERDMYQEIYEKSCIFYEDNRYVAKLPWKTDHPTLPTNKSIALRRTESVIRRLSKEPHLLRKYGEILQEQLNRGFIERVDENVNEKPTKLHYIPHHPVKKDSTTTPIRIVYDCSCKQTPETASLNDCLQDVPPQLNDITSILMRFRMHRYGITTDIEKAFLNVGLDKEDRDATRFFWLDNPVDPSSQMSTYRFRAVLFGATCSPFILNAVLSKHLKENRSKVTDRVLEDLYVDNIISSFETEIEVCNYFSETRSLFANGGFNLRSWGSNSEVLMDLAKSQNVQDKNTTIKTLGLMWNTENDTLGFSPITNCSEEYLTKREVLSESSKIYDPLGIIGPVTVRSKMFVQTLWQQTMEWDTPLNEEATKEWMEIRNDIKEASEIEFPRQVLTQSQERTTVHVFVDASTKAYGACAYLVSNTQSSLLMARNRVAPLKTQTIPRLELMAAVLGSRLLNHVTSTIEVSNAMLWSDSQIVLSWLKSDKTLKPFIANRVTEIKRLTDEWDWKYCPTESNPADMLTRGVSADKLKDSNLWNKGPEWLPCRTDWPVWNDNKLSESTILATLSDDKGYNDEVTNDEIDVGVHKIIDPRRFNSFKKLLRVTAYVQLFIDVCRNRKTSTTVLTPEAIKKAAKTWIWNTQRRWYQDVIQTLKAGSKRNCLVKQLKLYLDNEDMIRCEGRIHNAHVDIAAKFPLLLPKKDKLTQLIVMDAHSCHLHAGLSSTVTFLRQEYWIPSIRQVVKSQLNKCVKCKKVTGHSYKTGDAPPLPHDRLDDSVPFAVTGIDFTGALNVRSADGSISKAYICLFTCASTRALHLEVVTDLTEEKFILAFRRFVSRRSIPKTVISDNGTTFVSASGQIKILSKSASIQEQMNNYGIVWKFIPKRAPWFGGFWERMVRLTKNCVKKILGRSLITLETLQTIVTEVETILNDRPLTYISSDPLDDPLTPSKLLYGRRISSLPYPGEDRDIPIDTSHNSLNKMCQQKSELLKRFWCTWKHEYLTSLREYQRNTGGSITTIRKGDVVQVHEDTPNNKWTLAIVEELNVGGDGVTRSAVIRTRNGFTTRPVTKLYPLEINSEDDRTDSTNSDDVYKRTPRRAKDDAIQRIKQWTDVNK